MGWESDSPCCSHTFPGQERWSPGRCSSWELEFRDCGAIPGWGLLLTVERRMRGCEEGDRGGKCRWRKARQPQKQGNTAESPVGGGVITIAFLSPQASIGQLNSREAGPSNAWRANLQSRTPAGGGRGGASMWPTRQTTEKEPRQGSPLSAWMGGATEKDWPKRPSDRQLQEAQKKTDGAMTPAAEAVRVPAHLASPGSLKAQQLGHLHAQLSLGQSCHRQKKSCVCACRCRVTSVVSDPATLYTVAWHARLLCQTGSSPGKHTGAYWPILVAIPF